MQSVLFLDFDGVLHPIGGNASGTPFGRLPLLEAMLREARCAAVRIVVSSTWREAYSPSRLRSVFATDLRARVIDVTPTLDDYDGTYARWHEIRPGWPCTPRWNAMPCSMTWCPASRSNSTDTWCLPTARQVCARPICWPCAKCWG